MMSTNERMEWMKTLCNGEGRLKVECEKELAEFMEDVNRVIQCNAVPRVKNKSLESGSDGIELRVQGACAFSVVYRSNTRSGDGGLCGGEFTCDFEYAVTYPVEGDFDPDRLLDLTELSTDAVVCRPLGPRKLQLRCDLIVASCIKGNSFVASAEPVGGEGLQIQEQEWKATVMKAKALKEMSISHELVLPSEYANVDRLLDWEGRLFCDQAHFSTQGIVFKSCAWISCCYLPEGEQGASPVSFVLPLEAGQLLDCDAQGEGEAFVQLYPSDLSLEVLEDNSGQRRRLKIELTFLAEGAVYETRTMSCVGDCYSVEEELRVSIAQVQTEQVRHWDYCNAPLDFEIPLKDEDVVGVEMLRCTCSVVSCVAEGQGIRVQAKVKSNMLGIKKDNSAVSLKEEKELSLMLRPENAAELLKGEELHLELSMEIKEMDCSLSKDEFAFHGVACAKLLLLERKEKNHVVAVESLGKSEEEKEGRILLYYPEKNEQAWEIAKRFRVCVDSVTKEMEKEGGKTPVVLMLLA